VGRRLGVTVGALVAVMLVAAPPGGARVVTESKVTISRFLPLYHGKVKSAYAECEANRKVILYRKKPGADQKIGKDRANGNGKWKVGISGDPPNGAKYYAKVRNYEASSTGTGLSCANDKSPTVTFVGG
jgi:hypothetical protein